MKILQIDPHQPPHVTEIPDDLPSMQAIVGGTIQAVSPFDEPVALICNDEGKLLDLPLNCALRHPDTGEIYDIVAGTFFLCAAPPDGSHFDSLTAEQLRRYTKRFRAPETFVWMDGRIVCIPDAIEE